MVQASKLHRIINGWSNYLSKDAKVEDMATERAKVCSGCEFAVHGTYEKLMPDYSIKEVQGMKCEVCGCPLSTKLRSVDENCPKNKW